MYGKNIKDRLNDILEEKIQVFFQNKSKEDKNNSRGDFEMLYANNVTIKMFRDKSYFQNSEINNNFFNPNGNFEILEQKFMINKRTTFNELKECAWEFWGERNHEEFKFYDEKLTDINVDNDSFHNTHQMTVNKFMQINQFTTAVLLLKKPHKEQKIIISWQKEATQIMNSNKEKDGMNRRDRINQFGDIKVDSKSKEQEESFFKLYPNMKHLLADTRGEK